MSVIELNRINIIGAVDMDTPKIVIDEIARSHGMTPQQVIEPTEHLTLSVRIPYKKGHLRAIARYVNPSCVWNQRSLMKSFEFIQLFNASQCVIPKTVPQMGSQTPEHPYSYNACMLYKLHKVWGIKTYHNTTFDELALAVRLYLSDKNKLVERVIQVAQASNKIQLISMLVNEKRSMSIEILNNVDSMSKPCDDTDEVSLASIENIIQTYSNEKLLKRITPTSTSEAVVLSALNYQLDLTFAQNPLDEYHNMITNKPYIPSDEIMFNRFSYNCKIFDLSTYFNPFLPESVYATETLELLIALEGISLVQIQESNLTKYEYLQLVSFKPNIYHGLQMNVQDIQTLVYKSDITEIDPTSIVCIGTVNKSLLLTYNELSEYWDSAGDYLHPETNDVLPRAIINKLMAIHEHHEHFMLSHQAYNDLTQLTMVIHKIESDKVIKSKQVDHFINKYQDLPKTIQLRIRKCIQKLFILSMTMRGWKKGLKYPIEVAPVKNQYEVDINVTEMYNDFMKMCSTLDEYEGLIMDLPLFMYKNGEFKTTDDSDQGILLRDRLRIITDDRSVYSCIRTSSNWLAASAYRYMLLLKMQLPFDIDKLIRIA